MKSLFLNAVVIACLSLTSVGCAKEQNITIMNNCDYCIYCNDVCLNSGNSSSFTPPVSVRYNGLTTVVSEDCSISFDGTNLVVLSDSGSL